MAMSTTGSSPTAGFLTPADFAEMVGVTPATVQAWIRAGDLPVVRLGRLVFIPEDALRRLLEARSHRA